MKQKGLLFFTFFLISFLTCGQRADQIRFDHLTTSQGLSNNQIHSFFQDDQGFIWIGTLSGLNRFDGYEVKTFYHEAGDPNSLKNNTVLWMSYGPEGKIWVRNSSGISVYDPYTESFHTPVRYLELLQTNEAFISNMLYDKNGDSWFAIDNRGLVKIQDEQALQVNSSDESNIKIASNEVSDMVSDKNGNIWMIHTSGIIEVINVDENKVIRRYGLPDYILKSKKNKLSIFVDSDADAWVHCSDDPFGLFYLNTSNGNTRLLDNSTLTGEMVRSIIQHDNGDLWVGIDHGGISVLDKKTWKVKSVLNDPYVPKSLINNNVNSLYKDSNGIIWVATTKYGVNYHHKGTSTFQHFKFNRKDPPYNDMSSFAEDQSGNLWIGTNGKGLLHFNRNTNRFTSVLEDKSHPGPVPEVVVSLMFSKDNTLWIGSYLEGLFRFDGRRFSKVNFLSDLAVSELSIWDLYEDSRGNFWIGTLNHGVYVYNRNTGDVTNYSQSNELQSNYVTCIEEDKNGRVWIGTGVGLSVYDPADQSLKTYLSSDTTGTPHPLSNNSIISLHCDDQNRIWIGTLDGLNIHGAGADGFLRYHERDGQSSDIIMSILEDNQGNIWMSTSKGITKITIDQQQKFDFQTFDLSDGLQGEYFTEDAGIKTSDGSLIFAGQNGFNIFKPEEMVANERVPKLLFTNFFIANNRVTPGQPFNDHIILEKGLNETQDIYLEHDENSIAIEFVALSFIQSGKTRYQYMLEGFDSQWINASSGVRKANYTNLDYGHYTFRLRCSNSQNVWNEEEISFQITIHPPFWETPLAFFLYAVALVLILYFTRKLIIARERSKAKLENERLEAQRQHELDLMKIKFFTNVSHEFRTPISLVLSPIESMIKDPENIKVSDFKLIQRNAKRLLTLVNQLLDFRKMEANQHVLSQSSGDFVKFIQDIIESFSDLSREKEIQLIFGSELREYYTLFDKDKMEKIMFNLLSNAFKFTLPDGKIIADLEIKKTGREDNQVIITVSDTGIGIPKEKLPFIFNRFFQSENSGRHILNNGTGIGLSITKEFVELHGGKINVESTEGVGTSITVELPLKDISQELVHYLDEDQENDKMPALRETQATGDRHEQTVALVEDNADFRFYLKDNLKQYFNVLESSNGKDAWKAILDALPEVVISDIMMPGMNGLDLCRKIKADPRTSHIPVVLLTAQASDQHKIEGLQAGAIEYISKPFNFEILINTINSALRFQKRVNEAKNRIEVKTNEVPIVSVDEQLVTKAVKLVEENMSNSGFSVEDMSHELGYSRGHFYQKMIKITGLTPMDFIRNIRMKRAAELLKKSQLTVSEIAYKVGYNNPKLFSRYFKSQYHMYPSEFMSMHKEQDKAFDYAKTPDTY